MLSNHAGGDAEGLGQASFYLFDFAVYFLELLHCIFSIAVLPTLYQWSVDVLFHGLEFSHEELYLFFVIARVVL